MDIAVIKELEEEKYESSGPTVREESDGQEVADRGKIRLRETRKKEDVKRVTCGRKVFIRGVKRQIFRRFWYISICLFSEFLH